MDYSMQIANTLVSHLEEKEYHYEFDREKGLIRLRFKIKGKLDHVRFVLNIRDTCFISYGCIDMNVEETQRREVAEFLTRASYGMMCGNFEMDMRDGEVRYKVYVDCDHTTLSSQMIDRSLNVPILMFQRYGDELLKVMFGMESAEEAIKIIEG